MFFFSDRKKFLFNFPMISLEFVFCQNRFVREAWADRAREKLVCDFFCCYLQTLKLSHNKKLLSRVEENFLFPSCSRRGHVHVHVHVH